MGTSDVRKSKPATVEEYLKALPKDSREVVATVRKLIRKHLPVGYEEGMNWGAITYFVPLAQYPKTYNGQPLCYAALATQKNYFSLYLMCVYGDSKLRKELADAFARAGKKLDMGKSCVRFKSLDDLPLPAIGRLIERVSPQKYIAVYEASRTK
jgi:hypothetical protein